MDPLRNWLPNFSNVCYTSNKGSCEPVAKNSVTANSISRSRRPGAILARPLVVTLACYMHSLAGWAIWPVGRPRAAPCWWADHAQALDAKPHAHGNEIDLIDQFVMARLGLRALCTIHRFGLVSHRMPIKGPVRRLLCQPNFARSRCSVFEAFFFRSSSTTQTGEALSANTLHHRHHAVMLPIPSTTPPYLA
jgi:hypothetical protein